MFFRYALVIGIVAVASCGGKTSDPIGDGGTCGAPRCPSGTREVFAACGAGESCTTLDACGKPRWCASDTAACRGIPLCATGESELSLEACQDAVKQGGTCVSRTKCNTTIYCASGIPTCLAMPTCPPGYREVTKTGCAPDSECTKVSMCGISILCQKE